MCQNLIQYQRIVPLKNSLKQQVEHHKIHIMDSLGKIPDQNVVALPWKNMTKNVIQTLKWAGKVKEFID